MLKNINKGNWIIPPWDSRYGKLGHLWKKYNWDNLICHEDIMTVYYFIPPELVIYPKYFKRGWKLLKELDKSDEWCNWFSSKTIRAKLEYCELTPRDYFNLLILKTNDRGYAYRCDSCKTPLRFSERIFYGYNQTYPWNEAGHAFCCNSCSAYYQSTHLDQFPGSQITRKHWINARYNPYHKSRHDYISWLSRGNMTDVSYLYISTTEDGYLKYGVTTTPTHRYKMFGQYLTNFHILVKSDRLEVGNIESKLKLEFKGEEYITYNDLHKFFNLLKSILVTRPVTSPFD